MRTRLILAAFALVSSLTAQTATDLNEGLRLTKDSTGNGLTLFWYGRTGRTYFVKQSSDLISWQYLPIMDSGHGAPLSYGVSTSASSGFFRLLYTDNPLAGDPDGDLDGDGISNMDELFYAQYGYDPFDYFNGLKPTLSLLSGGGQWGLPSAVLTQPISVSVNNGASNAPVIFSVSSGGALLSADGNLPWSNLLTVRSSSSGYPRTALAYVKLPVEASVQSNITITAGYAAKTTTLQTTATTYDNAVLPPTGLQTATLSDSAVRLSWLPADVTRATSIEISTDNGASWQLYDVADPGVTSFVISGLSLGQHVLLRVITGDERKARAQGSSSLNTLDWLKGYAGLWGGLWEAVEGRLTSGHAVTTPTPEPLSPPSPPVSADSLAPLIIDVYEKCYEYDYGYNTIYYTFWGYVDFFGYDLISDDIHWQSALEITNASTDRRGEVLSTFNSTPFDDLVPYTWLSPTQTFSRTVRYHAYFDYAEGGFDHEEWGWAHQLHIRQDTVATPASNAGPATVADTRTYLVLGQHGDGSDPHITDYTGTLTFTKYSNGTSHIDTTGNLPAACVVVDNTAHTATLQTYTRSDNLYNTWVKLLPIEVEWVQVGDNWDIEDNKDADGKWMPGKGKKFFPDAKTQTEPNFRDQVYLKVSIGIPNITVHLKAFDVDDPTVDPDHLVDPNDASTPGAGNDNQTEALIVSGVQVEPKPPFFGPATSTSIDCVTDQYGVARMANGSLPILRVGRQPGDNYRIAATVAAASALDTLQVSDPNAAGYVAADSSQPIGFNGVISPMLTIWRKLNVEVDSMEKKPDDLHDYYSGTIADAAITYDDSSDKSTIKLSNVLPGPEDYYKNGKLTVGNTSYRVFSNHYLTDQVVLRGEVPDSIRGQVFTIQDDDDNFLQELNLPPALPQDGYHVQIIKAIRPKYAKAYIQIEDANDLGFNKRPIIPFQLNATAKSLAATPYDSMKDVHDSERFWAITLAFGYQWDEDHDHDPDEENSPQADTPKFPYTGVTMFSSVAMECFRDDVFGVLEKIPEQQRKTPIIYQEYHDNYVNFLYGTIAHEIGHSPGGQNEDGNHNEFGLMQKDGASIDADFTNKTITRFRKAKKWSY